ncbi:MAG: monovalent cation/H+ antiporter complex subunit F [Emergencia sp.]|nr:monovalent cation/H+ antiporter complex subunit F [Emergencia sp.]
MNMLLTFLIFGTVMIMGLMLIRVFKGPSVFDRLNGIFVIGIDVIFVLLLVGFASGRQDMFVDIAISYGILGFVSTMIIAMFLGGNYHDD